MELLGPCQAHRLLLKHFSDALLILLAEECQFTALILFEFLDDRLLLVTRSRGQDLSLEGLVLARLNFDCFAKLFANLNFLLLQALGLLFQLDGVFLAQLAFRPLRVLVLIAQFRLMLSAELLLPQHVHGTLLAILEFLRQLVMTQQHGVGRLQLGLSPIQLLTQQLTFQPVVRQEFGSAQPPHLQVQVVLLTFGQPLLLAMFNGLKRVLVGPAMSMERQ